MKRKTLFNRKVSQNKELVLVVEDNKNWQNIICKVLQELGYQPVCAQSFHQALEFATHQRFKMISLDLDLQDNTMLGRMFLQLMPQKNRKTPIVIVTGVLELVQNENLEFQENCRVMGVFPKQSFALKDFQLAIKEILQDSMGDKEHGNSLLKRWSFYKNKNLKSPATRLLASLILGILFYGAINLPFLWLAKLIPGGVFGTLLILGNLLAATITLVYVLVLSGRINSQQTVSIILALVSAISATRLFSSSQEKTLTDIASEKIGKLLDWFGRLATQTNKKNE